MQYINFGKFVRNKREKLGKSLNAFAIECEIDKASLSNFERGLNSIYFNNFIKIANGFNMTPAELLQEFEQNISIANSQWNIAKNLT